MRRSGCWRWAEEENLEGAISETVAIRQIVCAHEIGGEQARARVHLDALDDNAKAAIDRQSLAGLHIPVAVSVANFTAFFAR